MNDALRYDIPMPGREIDGLSFEIDDEVPVKDKEELVIVVVLVPVVFALHHAQTDHGVVHLAQRLVVPLVLYLRDQTRDINAAERWKQDVEVCSVWKSGGV